MDHDGSGKAALLVRCANGDRAAFRRPYDNQSPRLYGLAMSLLRQPGLAADVVHDAFLQVRRPSGRSDPALGPAEAWRSSPLRCRAIDILRRRNRQTYGQHAPQDVVDEAPDALEILSRRAGAASLPGGTGEQAASCCGTRLPLRLVAFGNGRAPGCAARHGEVLGKARPAQPEAVSRGTSGLPDALFPEDNIVPAGEYVLGALPPDERARVAAEMRSDAVLADMVAWWERSLAPLAAVVPPVMPPAASWRRIERSSHAAAMLPAGRPLRPSSPWRVRNAAAVCALVAAVAAGIAFVPRPPHEPAPVPLAALLSMGGPEAAFMVEAGAGGSVRVLPLHPAPVPAGRDLELWALAQGATAPQPLGVLPAAGRRLDRGVLPHAAARILASLEPRGGSTTGRPTGPVLVPD